ncbi:MAG: translation initiation factor IF-3 [Alphaproteobacteria bacterium]|jgi:translation initiation factor IF-3
MKAEPGKEGPRINSAILAKEVQLIDESGDNLGLMGKLDALQRAEEAGLDLVEVGNSNPPVCKIMDFGKYKFQAQKKASEARKKQKNVEIKEVKLRPNIDSHDYDVKMRAMKRFFDEGDKVKVTLRFRGREMAHQDIGMQLLQKVKADADSYAKVEYEPRLDGKQMIMILAPR